MGDDRDRYEAWYSERIWALLPEVYRAADSEDFDRKGPLRELVERIGVQAAIVRRSIDQMWDDQSIETCDGWAIPYIAELVGANLVAALNPRGLRLQAAKAIYYRRRAGTVSILEEAARDVTGWDTRIVEFFRRLTRMDHLLDPEKGLPSAGRDPQGTRRLQIAQHLLGEDSRTPAGGWADLRNAYAASRAHTTFDELSHTADVRKGSAALGWHNIPHLGVFVWRLHSFPESADDLDGLLATPVESTAGGCWTFDPTGREIPLFAAASRGPNLGTRWIAPNEWQLPAPIDRELFAQHGATHLYLHGSLGVFGASAANPVPLANLRIDPERGRFSGVSSNPVPRVLYHYGSAARIGAGAYDRRLPATSPGTLVTGGGTIPSVGPAGTLTINDSRTYTGVTDLSGITDVTIRSDDGKRPLIRSSAAEWKFTATADGKLRLEGMFVSGTDIVLAGDFERVTIAFSTLDPGSSSHTASSPYARAIDGRVLRPSRVLVDGHVALLRIESSITGPIRTRAGGVIERLEIDASVVQMVPSAPPNPGDRSIALESGEVRIVRSTILGPAQVHRIDVSESILDDVVLVDDPQHGCVRFSAWSRGSVLPRKYESVQITPHAPLFTSRAFGHPGYIQLRRDADRAIREGAENGSEMGACYPEMNAIKERSLLLELQELMPLGLVPVFVPVT
jgi:hypothetical protein